MENEGKKGEGKLKGRQEKEKKERKNKESLLKKKEDTASLRVN